MNIEAIEPVNISDEQERWNLTAKGVLQRLLWQIETGQIKPRELAVAFLDFKEGERTIRLETTNHDSLRMNGLLNLATKLHTEKGAGQW